MQEFVTSAGDELVWKQPKRLERSYELQRHGDSFGTLVFRSMWGTLAHAENPIQDWTFKRMGFLNPRVTARFPEADSDQALFHPKIFGGGTLQMLDGRPFTWEPINLWHTKWRFMDKSGISLLSFDQGKIEQKLADLFKLQVTVKVESSRITNQEFSLLVNLGFYLIVLYLADSAAAASAS
jgi:hypothetical protein